MHFWVNNLVKCGYYRIELSGEKGIISPEEYLQNYF